jgi:NADH-ubiquinone oxidoreductase chain 4
MFILLLLLLLIPLIGIIYIITNTDNKNHHAKKIGLNTSILNLIISLILFLMYDYSNIDFQFVQEIKEIKGINIYIGIDGISIYFILLTTIIMPLVILSN